MTHLLTPELLAALASAATEIHQAGLHSADALAQLLPHLPADAIGKSHQEISKAVGELLQPIQLGAACGKDLCWFEKIPTG